jgi:hypothetical protein
VVAFKLLGPFLKTSVEIVSDSSSPMGRILRRIDRDHLRVIIQRSPVITEKHSKVTASRKTTQLAKTGKLGDGLTYSLLLLCEIFEEKLKFDRVARYRRAASVRSSA